MLSPSGTSKGAFRDGDLTTLPPIPLFFGSLLLYNATNTANRFSFAVGGDVTRESDVSPAGSHPVARKTLLTRRDSRR